MKVSNEPESLFDWQYSNRVPSHQQSVLVYANSNAPYTNLGY